MTWPIKRLEEAAEVIMGQSPPSSTYNERGEGLPFFQGKAEFGEIYPIPLKFCSSPSRIAVANDILISVRAPVGNINIAKEKSCIGRGLGVLRAKKNILSQMFLFYFMKKNENSWSRLSTGSTFSAINGSSLRNFGVPVPSLTIQKQIVERMDKIAEARKLNDDLIQKSDELFNSIFYQEFQSKNNKWEIIKLEEVCERIEQKNPKEIFKDFFTYVDIASIDKEGVIKVQIISVTNAPSRARKLIQVNDTIFSTVRPYLKHIAFIPTKLDGSIASTGFCVIRPQKNIADPIFINFVVESDYFVNKILPFQRGASYPAVSDKDIYNQKVALPSLKEQKQIVAKLSAVREYKKQFLQQKLKLNELFNSVLHKSMNGGFGN